MSAQSNNTTAPTGTADGGVRAHDLAARLVYAWHSAGPGDRLDVSLSVAAALLLIRSPGTTIADLREHVRGLRPGTETRSWLRAVWRRFARGRPDLLSAVLPTLSWLSEVHNGQIDSHLRGAHAMIQAAARPDFLDWSCTPHPSSRADLLGALWAQLHTRGSDTATGRFFTPADAADLLASLSCPDLRSGMTVHDVAIGIGGLFRAVAEQMRHRGFDPATATWIGFDLDQLAIAACAVNAHLWDLGANVILGVGDVLTDEVLERVLRQRRAALHVHRAEVLGDQVRIAVARAGVADPPN